MAEYKIKTKNMKRITIEDVVQDGKDPILREISDDVVYPLNKKDRATMNKMIDYVRSSQDEEEVKKRNLVPAVGISAVQIGELKRMLYVRIENDYEKYNEEFALVNPVVLSESKKMTYLDSGEACLSIRDKEYEGYVLRPYEIKIRAIDYFTEQEIEITAKSTTAIVLMHEMDHLNGVMFYDRINKLAPFHAPKDAIKS